MKLCPVLEPNPALHLPMLPPDIKAWIQLGAGFQPQGDPAVPFSDNNNAKM